MAIPLTEGALLFICQRLQIENPVLQILSFKKIVGSVTDRYRMTVSDGLYSNSFVLLNTQENEKITNNELAEFSVVRVTRHLCNIMQGTKVIILCELEILQSGSEVGSKIGDPEVMNSDGTVTNNPGRPVVSANLSSVDESVPSLMKDLINEVANYRFTDFTLVCREREFPVYRLLLAARSPVFRAMFDSEDWKESKAGQAVIEDVKAETLEALVKFAHTDQVEDAALTTDLLAAADKYQMNVLVKKCEEKLIKSLTVANAADYYLVAHLHQAGKLKNAAKQFIVRHFRSIDKRKGLEFIVKHHPEALYELLQLALN